MIPFDFDYYRPESIQEALYKYNELNNTGKKPLFYGGGTEIISMARVNNIHPGAVIDIKEIPECRILGFQGEELIIGSGVTLTMISESKLFPLLGKACERIADHTIQDKITLGGNIAGTIYYREAVLPLLLCGCEVMIAGNSGLKRVPFNQVFNGRIQLAKGEMIIQIIIQKGYLNLPYVHVKKTKNEKIDYPLITLAGIKKGGKIMISFSGVYDHPVRSAKIEEVLNDKSAPVSTRIKSIIDSMPEPLNDIQGSSGYRKFLLMGVLQETIENLEGE